MYLEVKHLYGYLSSVYNPVCCRWRYCVTDTVLLQRYRMITRVPNWHDELGLVQVQLFVASSLRFNVFYACLRIS